MPSISTSQLSQDFDLILCDSIDALNFCYGHGLNKNIKVLSNSPSILMNNQINAKNLSRNFTSKKLVKYQKSIFLFSKTIFEKIKKNKKIDNEVAILCSIVCNQLSNFILKISLLDETLKNKKILFIKLNEKLYNADKINPPWKILSKELNLYEYSYSPTNFSNINNNKDASFLKRIHLGGLETILYRIASKFKILNFSNKEVYVISENEMIIELSARLFLKGYNINKLQNIEKVKIHNNGILTKSISKLIFKTLNKRIKYWVCPSYTKACLNKINFELIQKVSEYISWKKAFENELFKINTNKKKTNNIFLMNHSSSPKGLAIKNILNKKNMFLYTCQHGVTAEISDSHDYCLSQHDSSSSDLYLAFNKSSSEIARKNPFNKDNKQFIYGSPKRYKRVSKVINLFKRIDVLYLSNNLYTGNIGGIATWATDFEKAKNEINIINLLEKVNKKIFYKPYPEINKRYYEVDPCLDKLKNKKNIEVIKNNFDARYLINNSKLLICGMATSTVSWAIMSNIPIIFINYKYNAPLKADVHKLFNKSLFLFDYNGKNFSNDITEFVNKDFEEINMLWGKKIRFRSKLKENFISTENKNNLEFILNL